MRHVESTDSAQKRREMVGIAKPCAEYAYFRQCPHPRCKTIAMDSTLAHPAPISEPQGVTVGSLDETPLKAESIEHQAQIEGVKELHNMEPDGDAEAAREIDDDESIPLCS